MDMVAARYGRGPWPEKTQVWLSGHYPYVSRSQRLALNTIYVSLESLAYYNLMKRIFE